MSTNLPANISPLERADTGIRGVLKLMLLNNTQRTNLLSRSVAEYHPNKVNAFLDPADGVYNTIISGRNSSIRNEAILAQAVSASSNGFPVIILHSQNYELERMVMNASFNSSSAQSISSSYPCFEPMYKLSDTEIANQILEIATEADNLTHNARDYLRAMCSVIKKMGKKPSFKMLRTCPHASMFDKVEQLEANGVIGDYEAQDIKSQIMRGQGEAYKIKGLLDNLSQELSAFLYASKRGFKPQNIFSLLTERKVICFDIGSVTNSLLLSTIVYQLKLALKKGLRYNLIVDSISTSCHTKYCEFIKINTNQIVKTFASDDLYSMLGSDDGLFSTVVGNSQVVIVLNHMSGQSATKWAEFFGEYDRYLESYTTSKGLSKKSAFSLLASPNKSTAVNISQNREFIIKPEVIMRMTPTEAYIKTAALGQLAHIQLMV